MVYGNGNNDEHGDVLGTTTNKVYSDGNNDQQGDVVGTTTNKVMWWEQLRARSIFDGNNDEQGL